MKVYEFLKAVKEKKRKIAVIGDALVDENYVVDANRVSPEFPVPVLRSDDALPVTVTGGGALNVYNNFKDFKNITAEFIGFLDGYASNMAINMFEWEKVNQIPVKRRFYQDRFPLCRWDIEQPNFGHSPDELKIIQDRLLSKLYPFPKYDAIILSDYDKGTFSNDFAQKILERTQDMITIVDPKKGPISKWKGCAVIKPNSKEAKELSGFDDWRKQCEYFKNETDCTAVVITRGKNSVVGNLMGQDFEYEPDREVIAESICGAGDLFIAFLAMGLAYNFDILDVIDIAFKASSVFVQKKTPSPVSRHELLKFVDPTRSKFVPVEFLKDRDFKLVMSNGCFDDGLTVAHVRCLQWAKKQGDKLVVAINSDESVKRLKKGTDRPFRKYEERAEIVAGLDCVDYVIKFEEDTPLEVIKEMKVDVVVKGGDYKPEDVVGYGLTEVKIFPYVENNKSTTDKIKMTIFEAVGEALAIAKGKGKDGK